MWLVLTYQLATLVKGAYIVSSAFRAVGILGRSEEGDENFREAAFSSRLKTRQLTKKNILTYIHTFVKGHHASLMAYEITLLIVCISNERHHWTGAPPLQIPDDA